MGDKNFVVEREDYNLFNLPLARLIHLTKDSILANPAALSSARLTAAATTGVNKNYPV
jgi:hypothetical protein